MTKKIIGCSYTITLMSTTETCGTHQTYVYAIFLEIHSMLVIKENGAKNFWWVVQKIMKYRKYMFGI